MYMPDVIVHLTDLHFWSLTFNPLRLLNKRLLGQLNVLFHRRRHFDTSDPERLIRRLTELEASLTLLTGDFASTALREEFDQAAGFLAMLKQAGYDTALLPGNHDRYTYGATRQRLFESVLYTYCPAKGWPHVARAKEHTPLLLLDQARPNALSAKGKMSAADCAVVERCLAELAREGRPIVVAGHYPLLDATPAYSLRPGRRLQGAARLRQLLGECGAPMLYVFGHVHRNCYLRDPRHPRLFHLGSYPPFMRLSDGAAGLAFTQISINEERFQVQRHWHTQSHGWQSEITPPEEM